MDAFPLHACIRRLTARIPEIDGLEVHAYAVASRHSEDLVELRLITSYKDIDHIEIAEDHDITDLELVPLSRQLESMVREEFAPLLAAAAIQRDNIRAAHAQEVINYMISRHLIEFRASFAGDNPAFWPVLREVIDMVLERPQITIENLPSDILRNYQASMLFDYTVPRLGAKEPITVPRIVLEGATAADVWPTENAAVSVISR
ncbi:MAG: hypothetical protein PHX14_06630 [Syntrophomonadaceae bacterium]|nr:hypothetical protein [Syntrophomonadaceae bacterium]